MLLPTVEATPLELEQHSEMLFVRRLTNSVFGILHQGSGERSIGAPAGAAAAAAASSGTNLHHDGVTMVPQRCYITPSTLK